MLCLRNIVKVEKFEFCCLSEEGIIELDDATGRAIVTSEIADFELLGGVRKLAFDVIKQTPVTRAPTVDTLFHIAHNEIARLLMTHRLVE